MLKVLHSRLQVAISIDRNDLSVLTSAHFLIGQPMIAIPEHDITDISQNRLKRWQLMRQAFSLSGKHGVGSTSIQCIVDRSGFMKILVLVLGKSSLYIHHRATRSNCWSPPRRWPSSLSSHCQDSGGDSEAPSGEVGLATHRQRLTNLLLLHFLIFYKFVHYYYSYYFFFFCIILLVFSNFVFFIIFYCYNLQE